MSTSFASLSPESMPRSSAARFPAPDMMLVNVARGNLDPGYSISFWTWDGRRLSRDVVQAVRDKLGGFDLTPFMTVTATEFGMMLNSMEFLARACDAPTVETVRFLLEALRGSQYNLLKLAASDFVFVKDTAIADSLKSYVVAFVRVVVLLKWILAFGNNGNGLAQLKQLCLYGNTGDFYRSVMVNFSRLQDPTLRQYFVDAQRNYFCVNDLDFTLNWLSKNIDDLLPKTWKYATNKDVSFVSLMHFCGQYKDIRFPSASLAKLGGAEELQYLVFKYVHGSTNMLDMLPAFQQCVKFVNAVDFDVGTEVKKKAKAMDKPVVQVHATAVQRRVSAACEHCRNDEPYVSFAAPCRVNATRRTKDSRDQ